MGLLLPSLWSVSLDAGGTSSPLQPAPAGDSSKQLEFCLRSHDLAWCLPRHPQPQEPQHEPAVSDPPATETSDIVGGKTPAEVVARACPEFFLAYSTGHVGTTTLSRPQSYLDGERRVDTLRFFFEEARKERAAASVSEEEAFARHTYLPTLAQKLGQSADGLTACADLSHWDLYYFQGLLNVLHAEGIPLRLMRVRRDAIEAARSLYREYARERTTSYKGYSYKGPSAGFAPSQPNRILQIPEAAWTNFTAIEQALWAVDETEAQWRRMDTHAAAGVLECYWSEHDGEAAFAKECLRPVAELLGLRPLLSVPKVKTHREFESPAERAENTQTLLRYHERMMELSSAYRDWAARGNHDAQPPSKQALHRLLARAVAAAESSADDRYMAIGQGEGEGHSHDAALVP